MRADLSREERQEQRSEAARSEEHWSTLQLTHLYLQPGPGLEKMDWERGSVFEEADGHMIEAKGRRVPGHSSDWLSPGWSSAPVRWGWGSGLHGVVKLER